MLRKLEVKKESPTTDFYLIQVIRYLHMLIFKKDPDIESLKLNFGTEREIASEKRKRLDEMSDQEKKDYADKELAAWSMMTGYDLLSETPKKLGM